ncbi:hypothetical protein Patl1_29143 [Pistacia atlantica]|uniref:Uncharacterized protein n=1 Tax=Pistacia atlantica TaxID=434234 RepID=A0ACC1BFL3_9ROSI|nr:hypothetical protein Patl1_29143 [Pistacia atlantica]
MHHQHLGLAQVLKCEIKKQFYPGNVAYEARKKMREFKHMGPLSRGSNLGHKGSSKGVKLPTSPSPLPKPTPLLSSVRANHPSRRKMVSPITEKVGKGREGRQTISLSRKGRQAAL